MLTLSLCLSLLAIAAGTALRLLHLSDLSFNNDELYNMYHVGNLERGFAEFIAPFLTWEIHPPLSHLALYGWSLSAGMSEFAIRLPGALMGCVTLYFVYRIAQAVFDEETALYAAVFSALCFPLISLSRMASFHGWNIFFSTLSVWLGLRLLAAGAPTLHTRLLSVVYGVTLVCMGYVHYFGMFFALFQVGVFYWLHPTTVARRRMRNLLLLCLASFAPWWPIMLGQYSNLATHDYDRSLGSLPLGNLLWYFFNSSVVLLLLSVMTVAAAAVQLWKTRRQTTTRLVANRLKLIALLALGPIIVVYTYCHFGQSLWKNHYFGFTFPFLTILGAAGLSFVGSRYLKMIFLSALCGTSLIQIVNGEYMARYPIRVDLRGMIDFVAAEPHACAYLNHSWNSFNFDFYLKRNGVHDPLYLIGNGQLGRLATDDGILELDRRVVESGRRCLWFLNTYNPPSPRLTAYLNERFVAVRKGSFARAEAVLYQQKNGADGVQ